MLAAALAAPASKRVSVADRVEAAGIPPMSAEELNAEIQAYRMELLRAGV